MIVFPRFQPRPFTFSPQTDELAGVGEFFFLEQEECAPRLADVQANPWNPRLAIDNKITEEMGLVPIYDQEECVPRLADVQAPAWLSQPATYDESDASLERFSTELEDAWNGQQQPSGWTVAPPLYEEIWVLQPLTPESEESWMVSTPTAFVQSILWTSVPFLDDEIGETFAGLGLDQVDSSLTPTTFIFWSPPPAPIEGETFSTIFFGQDDRPTEFSNALVQSVPWNPRPFLDDEIGAYLVYDQEDLWSFASTPTVLIETIVWTARPFLDDEICEPLQAFDFEIHEPSNSLTQSIVWTARSFLDDEAFAAAPVWHDEPFVGQTQYVAWFYQPAVPIEPDSLPLAPPEHDSPAIFATQSIAWLARPALDDEANAPLSSFALEQEEPATFATQSILWTPRPFLDDETGEPLKGFGIDQQDDWNRQQQTITWTTRPYLDDETTALLPWDQEETWTLPLTQFQSWASRPFLDDEIGSTFEGQFLDSHEPWVGQTTLVTWTARPFMDDEATASPLNFALAHEESGPLNQQLIAWTVYLSPDDQGTSLVNQPLDHHEPWVPQTTSVAWVARPYLDDETSTSLASFSLLEEDVASLTRQALAWTWLMPVDDDQLSFGGIVLSRILIGASGVKLQLRGTSGTKVQVKGASGVKEQTLGASGIKPA